MYNPTVPNMQPPQWPGGQANQFISPNYQQAPSQPQRIPIGIPGRVVKNPNEIRPNDVPMDGSPSYFPTDDGNYIFAKCWNSDGTIRTVRYGRIDEAIQESEADISKAILDRLDRIEKALSQKKAPTKKEE
jgi:hypothetical protein